LLLNINNRTVFSRVLPKVEVCGNPSVVQEKSAKNNPVSLQAKLNFMGMINKPLVHNSASVLDKYLEKMKHYRFQDATILYKHEDEKPFSSIMLLDNPLCFPDAILSLKQHITDFKHCKKQGLDLDLEPWHFCKYNEALSSYTTLKNVPIKGIIGQGTYSTAFLTIEDDIIKLSPAPIFPSAEKFIEDVEIPILERYLIPKGKNKGVIRGMKEPLVENSLLNNISEKEYLEIRRGFSKKIKGINPIYEFNLDFPSDYWIGSKQIGFLRDKPYILDHQVIKNRPLYEHY